MPDDLANIPGSETEPATTPAPAARLRIRGAAADGRPPASAAAQYYLIREGRRAGPFPREVVETLLRSGSAKPQDLGWQEGQSGWRPLGELLPGIHALVRVPEVPPDARAHPARKEERFTTLLFGSLAYPFQGDGLIILTTGALALLAVQFLSSFLGFISLVLALGATGYLFGALQIIVQSSAQGEPELPRWPAFEGWRSDVLSPALLWLATLLGCFGPALLAGALARQFASPGLTGFAAALGLGGIVYYPMALLGVALTDSLAGLNPMLVFRSMGLIPGRYAATVAVLALLLAVQLGGGYVAEQAPVKLAGYAWSSFNTLYFALVQARILGVLYYANREQLAWF